MRLQINQEWIFIFCSFFLKLDFVAPLRLIGFQFAVEFSIVDVVSLVKGLITWRISARLLKQILLKSNCRLHGEGFSPAKRA